MDLPFALDPSSASTYTQPVASEDVDRLHSDQWHGMLAGTDPGIPTLRRRHRMLPASPRCKTCNAPFAGVGGWLMRRVGRGRWEKNPTFCRGCFGTFRSVGVGGAEVELSLLFADIRGSTTLGETMAPSAFMVLLNRFYEVAADTLIEHDAIVDKFVGDEAVGLFIPGMTGSDHAVQAVAAARDLVARTGRLIHEGRPLPIGVGVHTGNAFVGLVGKLGSELQFTALGDAVNTCARLASLAGAGEVLVSASAAEKAGLETSSYERKSLALKGRAEPLDTFVVTA
jgi:adenylate cyclase